MTSTQHPQAYPKGVNSRRLLMLGALLLLLLLPLVIQTSYLRHLFILAFIYAVIASNWDLSQGYGGIFNFGHLAFFGLGAYTTGVLTAQFNVNPWLALLASAALPTLVAALVAFPAVRLRGIYVILVTFAFGQLCLQLVVSQGQLTGGTQGLVGIPALMAFGHDFGTDQKLAYYYTALALLVVSTVYLRTVVRSDTGLAIIALRDQEEYSVARGVSLVRTRLAALTLSAVFTGLIGGFYATYLGVVSPDVFSFSILAAVLGMLLLGGLATVYGPIFAAFLITFLTEAMVDFGPVRYLVIAVLMIIVLRVMPGGLYSFIQARQGTR